MTCNTIAATLLLSLCATVAPAQPVRMIQWNIEFGKGTEDRTIGGGEHDLFGWHFHTPKIAFPIARGDAQLDIMARDLAAADPEIVTMEEVVDTSIASWGHDQASHMADALHMHHVFDVASKNGPWGIMKRQGNAVLSKYPIDGHQVVELNPESGSIERRISVWAHVAHPRVPGGVWVVAVHAAFPDDAMVQSFEENLGHAIETANAPVLMGGDFNATPDHRAIKGLAARLQGTRPITEAWAEKGDGDGFTVPQYHPTKRIDMIWHTGDIRLTRVSQLDNWHSAHRAIVAEFEAGEAGQKTATAPRGAPGEGPAMALLGVGSDR